MNSRIALVWLALTISCTRTTEPPIVVTTHDMGQPEPDQGSADADHDAPHSLPTVDRAIIDAALLDGMPLDSHVLDPLFAQAGAWIGYDERTLASVATTREVVLNSPSALPSLRVDASPNPVVIGGIVRAESDDGAVDVSVWLGRESSDVTAVDVAVLGLDPSSPTRWASAPLSPDSASRTELGGRTWVRYQGTASQMFGLGYFFIRDASTRPLFVHVPVIVPAAPAINALRRPNRAPTTAELAALQQFAATEFGPP